MRIRQKILIYFSSLSVILVGISFILIYTFFANYRRETFQRRLTQKTVTTLKFLVEVKEIDSDLLQSIDRNTLDSIYNEKTYIFSGDKKLLYSSLDDTRIESMNEILDALHAENPVVEIREGDFDVVGIYFRFQDKPYYGISKAYDESGFAKLGYLRFILFLIFGLILTIILVATYWLSRTITRPINRMASELSREKSDAQLKFVTVPPGKDEINLLATRFNELMRQLNESFSFQKHAVHHISHELKTPISILVSNFEKMEREKNPEKLRELLQVQKEDTRNLSDIIHVLLEIAKVDAGNRFGEEEVRMDELIFDAIAEINILHEDFRFQVNLDEEFDSERLLIVKGNRKLLKLMVSNLLTNCVQYSATGQAEVHIYKGAGKLHLDFENAGPVIDLDEKQFIFQHFFRGKNGMGKGGFGLGLVMIHKIVVLHKGTIAYHAEGNFQNRFGVTLRLS